MSHLEQFVKHCHNNILSNNAEAEQARDYLINTRGLRLDTIKKHNLGYCFSSERIPKEIEFYGREDNGKEKGFAYKIKGHLFVPIYDEFGEPIAFATRRPASDAGNSWWNCPYKKSNHLFLLDKARKDMFNNNRVYLVEGYMDAIILSQEGLPNVVGLMGVTISPRKLGLIIRYCNNICLCMDVDANQAGQNAQDKAICVLDKYDFCESISILNDMPVGKDPDDFVLENGIKALLSREHKLTYAELLAIHKSVNDKEE